MKRFTRVLPVVFVPAVLITLGAAPWRDDDKDGEEEVELEEARVFVEFNSTDEDFGIQFFWDGTEWKKMKVEDPDGRTILKVEASKSLALQGLTEGFFESGEPEVSELPLEQFLARFPEGEYEFEGKTIDGENIEGEAEFTHTIPGAPENLFPADGDVVNAALPLVVSFDAVTEDLNGAPLTPTSYEVLIENEDETRIFSIILDGDLMSPSVTVPPEFIKPGGAEYKLEVIVQEEGGNRTISETEFTTL